MNTALLFSLLFHALLLSITVGGQTFGLPGLAFPWKERRLEANVLHIQLAPKPPAASASALAPESAPAPADPLPTAKAVLTAVDQPAVASDVTSITLSSPTDGHIQVASVLMPPTPAPTPATAAALPPEPVMPARKRPDVNLPIAPDAPQVRAPATSVAQNVPAQGSDMPVPGASAADDAAQKQIDRDTQERALEQVRLERQKQNAERLRQAELMAVAQREAARQEQARAEQTARSEAARIEVERSELARQESLRRQALRQERARQDDKAQQEAARQELERAEAARLDAGRREAIRQEQTRQAQLEAAQQAQLYATRQEAIKKQEQEAARRDAVKQETARQDAVKQEAARQERARQEQRERAEQEAKREERLRAIGKQLDDEAAQRDAALNRPSRTLLPTVSNLRRGWLFGRADANTELVLYAEAMSRKIEMNMTFDMVREALKQPHAGPIVTVAIRADGSVEKVTFVVSSGVAAIDEAIRKVVASQAPYPAFTPALARQYDVIEIRRNWIFDIAIRLQ